ncbi:MAG TPA: glycosyltransferase [Anaerolineales bacterium]|jgi:glycosyltransferase involved in cell wall biosynthesis|nr:glycosyltransferase [Anaerolineales bacterium]
MRIGMMVDTYKPYVSGVTNHVELHKLALERAGHEVYIFTFGDEDYQDDEPRVMRSPGVALADTGFYLSLRYKSKHKKLLQTMDVVHVHHPFLSGRLALNYCRSEHIPIVFTNHSRYDLLAQAYFPLMPDEVSHSLLQAYMPDFCEAVDLVISPSESMARNLRELDVKSHIEVIPNGVDLQKFHQAMPFPRSRFGFHEQDILLIYAGRIAPEKNLSFLLQAFAGIAQMLSNVYLLMVGGGKKNFEEEVQNLIVQLGIGNRVHSTGMIDYDDIPSYLAMCDIFVTSSVAETFGMSTVEAMGVGLPIMGIHGIGTSDLVEDGKTGFLSSEDLAAFTAKLTYLCLNPSLRKEMGLAACQASEQYDIERTTNILLSHYTRLTQNTRPLKRRLDERLMSVLEEFMK